MKERLTARSRIFVAGHRGLVGSAVIRRLEADRVGTILTATRERLDLRDPAAVNEWFGANRPEYVIVAAGTVGGILANSSRPVDFLYDNLMIHAAVVRAAHEHGVRKLLYLGSACIYPIGGSGPIAESALLTGALEPTNEPYAIAKIAGVKLCQAYRRQFGSSFISAMPTNVYGPGDNFDPVTSHVVPALIRKFHDQKLQGAHEVSVWGTGTPRRELMHVDDLASACVFLLREYDEAEPINVGTGEAVVIGELARMIRDEIHPGAEIVFDASMPDGASRQLLDVRRLHALGWRHRIPLRQGIAATCRWFLDHLPEARRDVPGREARRGTKDACV